MKSVAQPTRGSNLKIWHAWNWSVHGKQCRHEQWMGWMDKWMEMKSAFERHASKKEKNKWNSPD